MDAFARIADVTLAILAGGAGKRMGFPKQNLQIATQPILEYLANRFAWAGPTLVVTTPGREHPPGVERFDAEVVDSAENQGPLRGILTALEAAKTQRVVITTVDMPGLTSAQLRWLLHRLSLQPALHGLMSQRIVDGAFQLEPFPFVCRRDAAMNIAGRLAEGRRSVHSLAALPEFAAQPAPNDWPLISWTNLNSPADYQSFMKCLQAGTGDQ